MALRDQPFAVARDHTVKLDRLADQIRDHREETDVGVEAEHRLAVPHPVDGQRSENARVGADGHADEGNRRPLVGALRLDVGGLEQRIGGDVVHDERHRGRDDLSDGLFRKARPKLARRGLAPSGTDDDIRRAVVIEQGDDAVPHLHEGRKHVEHIRQRHFEPSRRSQDLRDFVDAREGDLAQGRGLTNGCLTDGVARCEVSMKHCLRSNVLGANFLT